MKALLICENLLEAVKSGEIVHGRVHSVFDNACNIEFRHKFVTLLSITKEMVPMGVIVDNGQQVNFKKLGVEQNLKFHFTTDNISCTEKNIFICLLDAKLWFPGFQEASSTCRESTLHKNIDFLEKAIASYGKKEGSGLHKGLLDQELTGAGSLSSKEDTRDKSIEFITQGLLNFVRTAAAGNTCKIAEAAEGIIGFGPGLTPAMDDFICGMMISFIYLGNYYKLNLSRIFEFNRVLISKGIKKTTKISSEMLKLSAEGKTNQAARELIQAILQEYSEPNIKKALARVINIGETSGSDMALGIYTGCKILANKKHRGEWSNETMCGYQEGLLL